MMNFKTISISIFITISMFSCASMKELKNNESIQLLAVLKTQKIVFSYNPIQISPDEIDVHIGTEKSFLDKLDEKPVEVYNTKSKAGEKEYLVYRYQDQSVWGSYRRGLEEPSNHRAPFWYIDVYMYEDKVEKITYNYLFE